LCGELQTYRLATYTIESARHARIAEAQFGELSAIRSAASITDVGRLCRAPLRKGGSVISSVALAETAGREREREREGKREAVAPQRQRVGDGGTVRVEWEVGSARHALARQKLVRLAAALWASRRAETKKMAAVHGGNVAIV